MAAVGSKRNILTMYKLLRPLLFSLDAETSHNLVMGTMALGSKHSVFGKLLALAMGPKAQARTRMNTPVNAMGIQFPNPVGLAPGLDKQGNAANMFHRLGFGFVELGTVTPLPQPGNPRPRIFRLKQEQALINRMGFNSVGLDRFLKNVSKTHPDVIKGINIGKNAATPMASAIDDYLSGLRAVYSCANYVSINISSPNTKNLRELQSDEALEKLLKNLHLERLKLTESYGKRVPLVVKIAPDLDQQQITSIASLTRQYEIDGIAATNTTIDRKNVEQHIYADEPGGLSGAPLREKATRVVDALYRNLQDEIPIIGIGGIDDASSAMEKFQAGAKLVQIYTGLIYQGPNLVTEILEQYAKQNP